MSNYECLVSQNHTDAMESNNQKVRPDIEDSSDNLDGLKKIAKRTLKGVKIFTLY